MPELKQKVVEAYTQLVKEKVMALQARLQEVIDSTHNETKSSAGDKYETGRAMLQIEQDNIRKQLQEALAQKAAFESIRFEPTTRVVKGSLVKTDHGYFFLSVALAKINVGGIAVMSVSPQSPVGSKLIGLNIADTATINERIYSIEGIA